MVKDVMVDDGFKKKAFDKTLLHYQEGIELVRDYLDKKAADEVGEMELMYLKPSKDMGDLNVLMSHYPAPLAVFTAVLSKITDNELSSRVSESHKEIKKIM